MNHAETKDNLVEFQMKQTETMTELAKSDKNSDMNTMELTETVFKLEDSSVYTLSDCLDFIKNPSK